LRNAADILEMCREEVVSWLIRESGSTRLKANLEWATLAELARRRLVYAQIFARDIVILRSILTTTTTFCIVCFGVIKISSALHRAFHAASLRYH